MTKFELIHIVVVVAFLIGVTVWVYWNVWRESPVAKATRILEQANTAFSNGNLVALEFQLKCLGEIKCQEQQTTHELIVLLIKALKRSGEAKVTPK